MNRQLQVGILLEADNAALAADSALLHAAEGRVGSAPRSPVHLHHSGLDPASHLERAIGRAIDAPRKPEDGVVGNCDRLLFPVIGDDGEDWAEYFVLRQL